MRKIEIKITVIVRPVSYTHLAKMIVDQPTEKSISIGMVQFPARILLSSYLINDRFIWSKNKGKEFYQYLGIRNTAGSANTGSLAVKTVQYIYESLQKGSFIDKLLGVLNYLDYENTFTIQYQKRYKKLFFQSNISKKEIDKFYTEWWNSPYTKRKKNSIPYSKNVYDKLKRNPDELNGLIKFLKILGKENKGLKAVVNSNKNLFEVDILKKQYTNKELQYIQLLTELDVLTLKKINIKKKHTPKYSIEESSSGEYHLILSLIGLFSRVQANSLILMDEPEISLHPNWQMKFINYLKQMFHEYSTSHFIIATHSHFMISDLEGDNSAVVSLMKDEETKKVTAELLEGKNTYGWSAEEVLYSVFNVRTTRNYYLEQDLTKLLGMIGQNSRDKSEIKRLIERIEKMPFTDEDPLNEIIVEAKDYMERR